MSKLQTAIKVAPKLTWPQFIPPTVALAAYGFAYAFDAFALGYEPVVFGAIAYMFGIWAKNIFNITRPTYRLETSAKLWISVLTVVFGLCWVGLQLSAPEGFYLKLIFTLGPLGMGLAWLLTGKMEEVQDASFWRWAMLPNRAYKLAATRVYAVGYFLLAGAIHAVASYGSDTLWIFAMALLPLIRCRLADFAVSLQLLRMGARPRV